MSRLGGGPSAPPGAYTMVVTYRIDDHTIIREQTVSAERLPTEIAVALEEHRVISLHVDLVQ